VAVRLVFAFAARTPAVSVALAADYLAAVRRGGPTADAAAALAALDEAALPDADDARVAFWTNVYNAAVRARLRENPDRLRGPTRHVFFARSAVTVAGHDLSPNGIEHGLLRGSRLAVGLGYLPRPRPDAFERAHRVRDPDPRVHFALNCGAASCPVLRAYDADAVDAQLDAAARAHLAETVRYDRRTDTVTVPRILLWFRGDFGGLAGVWALLDRYDALPPGASAGSRLRYAPYDWSVALDGG